MSCTPCSNCPQLPLDYNIPSCPDGEPCEEILFSDCLSYKGPNLPALGIMNTDRLSTVLFKMHKLINDFTNGPNLPLVSYLATNTGAGATPEPFVVKYLGKSPVFTLPGASSASWTITVPDTSQLQLGMMVEVVSGTGVLQANTKVDSIVDAVSFTVDIAPSTDLDNATLRFTGFDHVAYEISVVKNTPQIFNAFPGSIVVVSGTGTTV